MNKKYTWSRHVNDEIWYGGPCDTVKECVDEARYSGYCDTDTFVIGYVVPYQPEYVNSESIIEYLQQDAYDEIGEVSDGWLDYITKEQREDLERRVLKDVLQWLKDWNKEPSFYKIEPIDELTLQEALEKYAKDDTEEESE